MNKYAKCILSMMFIYIVFSFHLMYITSKLKIESRVRLFVVNESPLNTLIYRRNNIQCLHKESHNLAPFYNRCQHIIKSNKTHNKSRIYGLLKEGIITKQFIFSHVYKSGGTTIQAGLRKLFRENHLNKLDIFPDTIDGFITQGAERHEYKHIFKFITDETFVFTFVRDPISKFLSGFGEVSRRQLKNPKWIQLMNKIHDMTIEDAYFSQTGIELMRIWLDILVNRTFDVDDHLLPNTWYLMLHNNLDNNVTSKIHFNFDYIGDIRYVNEILPDILDPFINNTSILKHDNKKLMEYFEPKRRRPKDRFNIDKELLSDDDIIKICDVFWVDYLCLGFDIPKQCNVTEMFLKHYNNTITYLDDDDVC